MCYDVAYLTKRQEDYARRYGKAGDVAEIKKRLPPVYHSNGFDHGELPVITNTNPDHIQLFTWGLIPFWVKNPEQATKISNSTLNARGEELWEKPAFKNSIEHRRCLVIVDGFYEHHWKGDKSYPYFIKMKDDRPFSLGGIWSKWKYKDLERNTFSIITTAANPMMAEIHNKPKASEGPRMPFIVPEDKEHLWLSDLDKAELESLIKPYDQKKLSAYTVGRLRGKAYPGNVPEIIQPVRYEEVE